MGPPRAFIIAGPNGAGKTTFAREFLSGEANCSVFINADLIAAGLSPLDPDAANARAMRLMAEEMHARVSAMRDFAIETTLAGRTYLPLIREWRSLGYRVKIIYLWLDCLELAVDRVRLRVAEGGHNVPEATIRRRFHRSWTNFMTLYRPLANVWQVYDCCGPIPRLMEEGENQ